MLPAKLPVRKLAETMLQPASGWAADKPGLLTNSEPDKSIGIGVLFTTFNLVKVEILKILLIS